MVSSEKSKPAALDFLLNSQEFKDMRKKLTTLRERVYKPRHMKIENLIWNYPRHEETHRRASADVTVQTQKVWTSPNIKKKDKDISKGFDIPKTARKLKRVPPPNFMIGMRDLSRVYTDKDSKKFIVHTRYNTTDS